MRRIITTVLLLLCLCAFVGVSRAAEINDYFAGRCARGFAAVSLPYKGEDATKPRFESDYALAAQLIYKCKRVNCGKPVAAHNFSDMYGIVIAKYNNSEKIMWATNFEWVVGAKGFYEFFEGSRVEPWGPTRGYERIFEVVEKLFSGSFASDEEVLKIFKDMKGGG